MQGEFSNCRHTTTPPGKGKRSLHSLLHVACRGGQRRSYRPPSFPRALSLTMFHFSSPFHSHSKSHGHRDTAANSTSAPHSERSSRSRMSLFRSPEPSPISARSNSRLTNRSTTPSPNGSHSDLSTATDPVRPPMILGICAMDVKARSKAMREILTRLVERSRGTIEVKVFGDKVILDEGQSRLMTCTTKDSRLNICAGSCRG